jgi:hypothetical protein
MNQIPLTRTSASPNTRAPAQATAIPLTKATSSAPATHRVLQTLEGKNRYNNHIIDVIDKSGDKSQTFGYLIHCQTCAFEGRYLTVEEATANAKMHVGL